MGMLQTVDPEVFGAIQGEIRREEFELEMIASENYVSPAVLEAAGSVMTNKYAEGYPGKRYYGGCEHVDQAEQLAMARAKELFGAAHVNVQPHSGSQANMAVYFSVCKPGDTILGMSLAQGGHLTHGSPVNFSGFLYNVVSYGLDPKTERIDLNQVRELAKQHRPKLIVVGASAYPRAIDYKPFRDIADEVGAKIMADIAHPAGLVATGLHPSPVPHCDFVTTTTHKTLRGPRGGMVMCREEYAKTINSKMFPGIQGGPLMHVIAAKAVAFKEALAPSFKDYCRQIIKNTQALAAALVASGFRLVSGGSDTHLVLVDLTPKGLTGKETEAALGRAGITVNKNAIPGETRPPSIASGIRIGTAALTTRGMKEDEMRTIVGWINEAVSDPKNETKQREIKETVKGLCRKFPFYAMSLLS